MVKCLKCAIKKDSIEKKIERYNKCIDCKNGSDCIECEDCGDILVYCKVTEYGHDGETLRDCGWFKPKND